jgi:hypothetical protein
LRSGATTTLGSIFGAEWLRVGMRV